MGLVHAFTCLNDFCMLLGEHYAIKMTVANSPNLSFVDTSILNFPTACKV